MSYLKISAMALAAFLLPSFQLSAQDQPEHHKEPGAHDSGHMRVSAVIYHTYIGTRTSEGKDMLIVPSLGLDVEYWFSEKWGIGSHNDLELISFEVERGESLTLEREAPLLLTVDALWKPWKGLVLLAGPGVEFEREENLFVVRGGLEYELELGSHWDVAPTVFYDSRKDAYDTFSVGIGIGKRF
jgi:hypothetical protein